MSNGEPQAPCRTVMDPPKPPWEKSVYLLEKNVGPSLSSGLDANLQEDISPDGPVP